MRAAGMFLNEGEKENKREEGGGGIEIGQCVWRRKTRRKKMYGWNEMKERRNNIKNKKF